MFGDGCYVDEPLGKFLLAAEVACGRESDRQGTKMQYALHIRMHHTEERVEDAFVFPETYLPIGR